MIPFSSRFRFQGGIYLFVSSSLQFRSTIEFSLLLIFARRHWWTNMLRIYLYSYAYSSNSLSLVTSTVWFTELILRYDIDSSEHLSMKGFNNFMEDIRMMLGRRPLEPYWFLTWCIFGPIITLVRWIQASVVLIIMFSISRSSFSRLSYDFEHPLKETTLTHCTQTFSAGWWFVRRLFLFLVLWFMNSSKHGMQRQTKVNKLENVLIESLKSLIEFAFD